MAFSVLIIDDNATTGGVLKELFQRYNIDVTLVGTFAAGIAANRIQPRNLVALDLELPDSPDILKTLARANEFKPSQVVVVTGHEDTKIIEEMNRTGQAYILKGEPGRSMFSQLMESLGLTNDKGLPIKPSE